MLLSTRYLSMGRCAIAIVRYYRYGEWLDGIDADVHFL